MDIATTNSSATVLASWIFGSALLVFLMGVLVFMRGSIGAVQARLTGFFCALLSGFFAYFFISTGSIEFKSSKVQTTGAVAVFLLVLGLSWRKETFASDAAPTGKKKEPRTGATQTGISPKNNSNHILSNGRLKSDAKRLRTLGTILLCFTAAAVGMLYTVGSRSGISIETIPPYDSIGGDTSHAYIAGSSTALNCDNYYVVIYALTDKWHVQPTPGAEVALGRDSGWRYCRWSSSTHTGTHYAALLVVRSAAFHPDEIVSELPLHGYGVVASTVVQGTKTENVSRPR